MLGRRFLGLGNVPPRKRSDPAVLRPRKTRHQPFDGMQTKAGNPKSHHDDRTWLSKHDYRSMIIAKVISVVYFVAASERGTKPTLRVWLLISEPSDLIENSVSDLEPVFPTN